MTRTHRASPTLGAVLGDPDLLAPEGSGRCSNGARMEKFTLVVDGFALAAAVVAVFIYVKPAH
jgi:hypothetical protein